MDARNKVKLTEAIIAQLPEDSDLSVEQAMRLWWYNIRSSGGLRLTDMGYFVFKNVMDIESYSIDVDIEKFDRMLVLKLDRKLQMPYYIETKKKIPLRVIMFGSREALLARLYGDLDKFLSNY